MKRCPVCNSEMLIEDEHIIKVTYKVINGERGKHGNAEKPNETNRINSKLVCQNCKYTVEI